MSHRRVTDISMQTLLASALAIAGCGQETPTSDESPPPIEEPVSCPSTSPTAAFVYPSDGATHTATFIEIAGTAAGADSVEVTIDGGSPLTAAGGSTWRTTVQLTKGPHTLTATPIGAGGCPDGPSVTHTVVQGEEITLVTPPSGNVVELRLDRLALEELLPLEAQKRITLTRLDLRPLVLNALAALEDPVAWGFDTSAWGDAEHNLAGLLVMSPDTADLEGTTLAAVMRLSGQLGLPPARILSDMLRLRPSERFLPSDIVADVMIENLIGTHPAFCDAANPWPCDLFDGTMPVTLADGLGDLAPLLDTYGPSAPHPGFLAVAPTAELFTPSFAMIVQGTGNVRVLPGLRPGEGFSSHVIPPADGDALLELDFESPDTFQIVGLHPEPRAALTLGVNELDARYDTLESVPDEPWRLERIVGDASRRAFETLWPTPMVWPYDLGNIDDAAVVSWDAGRVVVDVVADLGPPPDTAFIWDMILDVAQERLHDTGSGERIAEGDANVLLALPPLPIGLTAEQLIDTMRPILEEQKETLVGLMVGEADALPSPASIWLTDAPSLEVAETAPALYPSADALESGEGPVRTVSLGAEARTFWTRSEAGEVVVLDVGRWAGDHVIIGQTIMPEEP